MKTLLPILLFSLTLPAIAPLQAQNPPARTFQPGFWQPIARFDTKQAVEVNITNNTDIPLEYDLTDLEAMNPVSIQTGETGRLQGFGNSGVIVIYPLVESYSDFTLRFNITINEENNGVNVSVVKDEPTFFGHRAVNLQKTGAIYIY